MIWLALYFGALALRQYRSAELRQSELARALQLAELRLLKSQLNPHFLFNALNTVRSLIADDPAAGAGCRDAPREYAALHAELGAGGARYPRAGARDRRGLPRRSSRCDSRIDCASTATSPPTRAAYAYRSCCCRRSSRTPSSTESPSCRREACSGFTASLHDGALMLEVENPRPIAHSREAQRRDRAAQRRGAAAPAVRRRASLDVDLSSRRGPRHAFAFRTAYEGPDRRRRATGPARAATDAGRVPVDRDRRRGRQRRRSGRQGRGAVARSCCSSTSRCPAAPASICSRASITCRT